MGPPVAHMVDPFIRCCTTVHCMKATDAINIHPKPFSWCCRVGDEILSEQLSFGERKYWEGVVALIGLTVALNLIAYWILRRCSMVAVYLHVNVQMTRSATWIDAAADKLQQNKGPGLWVISR